MCKLSKHFRLSCSFWITRYRHGGVTYSSTLQVGREKKKLGLIRPPRLPRVPSRCCWCVGPGSSLGTDPRLSPCCFSVPSRPLTGRSRNPPTHTHTLSPPLRDRNDLKVQESHVTSPAGWCNASVNRSYCNLSSVQRGSSLRSAARPSLLVGKTFIHKTLNCAATALTTLNRTLLSLFHESLFRFVF